MTTKQWDQRINAFQEQLRERVKKALPEERQLRRDQLEHWDQALLTTSKAPWYRVELE